MRLPAFRTFEPLNFVYLFFLAAAWIVIQCLIGGTRLLFSLPAYGLLSVGAILTLVSVGLDFFKGRRRIPPAAVCVLSTLLLGGWVLYRSAHSPVTYLALPDFYMMMGCQMAYLLTAYFFNGQLERTVLIAVLWALAVLEVFCGLIQFLKDQHFMPFGLMRAAEIQRASGMFISPNHFAGFLEAVAIISLSMAVWSRWPIWAKGLAAYIAGFCWVGVAISGSRGGYFSTIASLVVFGAASIYTIRLADPRKFGIALIGVAGAVLLTVGLAWFLMAHSHLLTARMNTMVEKNIRFYNWEAAIDHIRVSPWIGTGAGTHMIYGRLFRRVQIQADPIHAHCDYLELVAEYGAVGGLCMLFFVWAHVWNGLRTFSEILRRRILPSGMNQSTGFAINLGALCAVAGLAVHSILDFNMHIPGNALLFAFIFGILANSGIEKKQGILGAQIMPWGRLLLPALGVWMICSGLPLLPAEWCTEQARVALRDHKYLLSIDYANLSMGRLQGRPGPEETFKIWGRPWDSYFGGMQGLIARFGGNPNDPDVHFYLGEANRALGARMPIFILKQRYFNAAIASYEEGLKVFPQDENALVREAQCYDGLQEYQLAEELYQRAFKVDPHLGALFGFYARHLAAEGNKAGSDAALKVESALDYNEVDAEQKADSAVK